MARDMRFQVVALFVCVFLSNVEPWCAQAWAQQPGAKKLIYYGWGVRDTQYVRDHWREMEQMPFDGTGIVVALDRNAWQMGETHTLHQLGWKMMGTKTFRLEEFREAITDLKAARWRTFTDNFLPVALSAAQSASGLTWFDDERWRIIANNFGVFAGIAAQGGVKGLILDPEHYNYSLFNYPSQRQQVDRPFEDYVDAARRRGREIMTAIAAHLPGAVILSLYSYAHPLGEQRRGMSLRAATYGLLPAFYDGILETMPAGGRLVDGYEFSYAYKERRITPANLTTDRCGSKVTIPVWTKLSVRGMLASRQARLSQGFRRSQAMVAPAVPASRIRVAHRISGTSSS